jgi:hypothetical protein
MLTTTRPARAHKPLRNREAPPIWSQCPFRRCRLPRGTRVFCAFGRKARRRAAQTGRKRAAPDCTTSFGLAPLRALLNPPKITGTGPTILVCRANLLCGRCQLGVVGTAVLGPGARPQGGPPLATDDSAGGGTAYPASARRA